MTKKSKKGKKRQKTNWGELADELESQGGGSGYFLKDGKNRFRIIPEDSKDDKSWYADVTTMWEGNPRAKKLMRAIPLGLEETKLEYVVIPKSALKGIFNILDEGYDLLSGEDAHGVTISKSGKLLQTSYTVMPSRKEVDIPEDYEENELTLEEAVEEIEKESKERDESAKKETGKTKKGKKGKKGSKKGKSRDDNGEEDDEDEEEEGW